MCDHDHTQAAYGLLGRKLGHSFSPQIHRALGGYDYGLFEKEPEELEDFLRSGRFKGLNVTIPYKKDVIPFCQELTDQARRIGSVNTIVRRPDGTLLGHNTDYEGFVYMLKTAGAQVAGKKVLVLGTGGASLTVHTALHDLGAGEVISISRSGPDNYTNLERHADAQLIVNATPVGMYPNTEESPLDLSLFPQCEGVFDLIYNPAKTQLLLEGERRGLLWANGLGMLVAQARGAAQLFLGAGIPDEQVAQVTREIAGQTRNLMLVGMPGCGKSTVGRELARRLGRPFIDLDQRLEEQEGVTIPQMFVEQGEEAFRQGEHRVLVEYARQSGAVIATGGGVVTRPENLDPMHRNSTVIFLRRPLELLPSDGRPVSQRDGVARLYQERLPLYEGAADLIVDNLVVADAVDEIIRRLSL